MKRKAVGYIIFGIGFVTSLVIYTFNKSLHKLARQSCDHASTCVEWSVISFNTNVIYALLAFILFSALYLIFSKDECDVCSGHQEIGKNYYQDLLTQLDDDESKILKYIIESEGISFQSDIVENTKFSKAKVSRILDLLEARGHVERRRRGMANVLLLKRKN